MKPPRTLLISLVSLLCLVLLAALAVGTASCGRSTDTTLAPATTLAPGSLGTIAPPSTAPGQAANQAATDSILFRDDFQDGDTEGWQISAGWTVQQQGDIYTFATTGTGSAFVPKGVSWDGDYAFKTSYVLEAGLLAFSFDATRNGRYYVAVDQDAISLVKEDAAGDKTVLTQAEAPEPAMQHYLTVAKKDGFIQVYVDKTLWLAYQDAAPLEAGTIIVGSTGGTNAWVDDVLVNTIGKALTQKAPAVAAVDPSQVVAPPDDDTNLTQIEEGDGDDELDDNNHPDDILQPVVSFTVRADSVSEPGDSTSVTRGSQVFLEWDVENAAAVFFSDNPVPSQATRTPTVVEDTTFQLEVTGLDGATKSYYVGVSVTDEGAHGAALSLEVEVTPRGANGLGGVLVDVKVTNVGDEPAHNVDVIWTAIEMSGARDKSQTIPLVEAGGEATFAWTYTYEESGDYTWLASANMDPPDAGIGQSTVWAQGEIRIE
jgi:hypothetical protein